MKRTRLLIWTGLGALIALFGIDLFLDVRARDALTWMDPYQYYEFARDVLAGQRGPTTFEVPSIFPFFVVPHLAIRNSISGALLVNLTFAALLVIVVHRLCVELRLRTPSPLVAALVLSSPLLVGLSRSLYVEFALTALVAMTMLLWIRFLRSPTRGRAVGLGLLVNVGLLTKMTFPVFVAAPLGGALVGWTAERRRRDALLLAVAVLLPIAVVVLIERLVFPASFGYYLEGGNTRMPIMYLIGPPELLSLASATYYFVRIGTLLLFLLTPFLVLALIRPWWRRVRLRNLAGRRAALWLWLLGPVSIMTFVPVKEPRHVAPCVVPAVLLSILAVDTVRRRSARLVLATSALLLAGAQYALVTAGGIEVPYFLDRPLHADRIVAAMARAHPRSDLYAGTPPALRPLVWRFNRNVAISGFDPNAAVALTWVMFPAVVYDLDTMGDPGRLSDRIPYRRFEDLFILTGFNTYNRRCGWRRYYETLTREQVVANAEFVILRNVDAADALCRFPDHATVAMLESGDDRIRILATRRRTTTPYREIYGREFLARNPDLPAGERATVANDLLLTAVLGGDRPGVDFALRERKAARGSGEEARSIYWIGSYASLRALAGELLRSRPSR